jgi:hypothetical protein
MPGGDCPCGLAAEAPEVVSPDRCKAVGVFVQAEARLHAPIRRNLVIVVHPAVVVAVPVPVSTPRARRLKPVREL